MVPINVNNFVFVVAFMMIKINTRYKCIKRDISPASRGLSVYEDLLLRSFININPVIKTIVPEIR